MNIFKTALAFLYSVFESIVLSLAILTMLYMFLFRPTEVQGYSMEPNLDNGQRLITEYVSYKLSSPQRGDIVVIKSPQDPETWLIKRLVGLPGESVEVLKGSFFINGEKVSEAYLEQGIQVAPGSFLREGENYNLAADEFFVMGDNRERSYDSRFFGPIKKEGIVGKAVFRFWPPQDFGLLPQVRYNN